MRTDIPRRAHWLLAALLALGSGCATITGSETQGISLQAVDPAGGAVSDAECSLSNDKGRWNARPPAVAVVTRSAEDLLIQCEATGRSPGTVRAISRANAGLFGNIIFGGAVGALIDHGKGTAYDYPSMVRVVFGVSAIADKREEPGGARMMPSSPVPTPPRAESARPDPGAREVNAAPAATAPRAAASTALPAPGTTFRYSWRERRYSGRSQEFQVRITAADDRRVWESFLVDGRPPASSEVHVHQAMFIGHMLAEGQALLEFAPYLLADQSAAPARPITAMNYPEDALGPWSVSIQFQGWDSATVPAGSYRAQRVEIRGTRSLAGFVQQSITATAARFEYVMWYAPDLKRYVKLRHRSWNGGNLPLGDEMVELLEYRAN